MEEEIRVKLSEMEQNYQQVTSTVRVMKTTGDDMLKKYNQRLLRLESLMEEHVVSAEDTSQSIMQLHNRLTEVEDTSCERARDLAICLNPPGGAAGLMPSMAPDPSSASATDRVSLSSLEAQVADLIRKMDQLQSESHDFLARVESQEERFKTLRTLADTNNEQYRKIGDRLEREDWDGRLKDIMSRLQDFEQTRVEHKESLEIVHRKIESSEQSHDELGNSVRRLQERGISALAEMKLDESADLQGVAGGEELAECAARLKECEDRLDALSCDVQTVRADQELGSRVATLVSSLKDVAPKVIAQDSQLKQLQEDLSTGMNLCTSRHKDMGVSLDSVDARIGRLETEVERLVSEVEGVDGHVPTLVETIPEEDEEDEEEGADESDLPEGFRTLRRASSTE